MTIKAGVYFSLFARKATPAAYIVVMCLALAYPVLALIMIESYSSPGTVKKYQPPAFSKLKCPLEDCVNVAYGPASFENEVNQLVDSLSAKYHKSISVKEFETQASLIQELHGKNKGKYGIGLFNNGGHIFVYTRDKQAGMGIYDPDTYKTMSTYVISLLNDYNISNSRYASVSTVNIGDVSSVLVVLFSYTFFIASIAQITTVAQLKDKRRYELLICNGLKREHFWLGIMLVSITEVVILLLVLAIIFTATKTLSDSFTKSFFLPFFSIFSALAQNIGFLWFTTSFCNTPQSMSLTYIFGVLICYMAYALILAFLATKPAIKVISAILQILLPPVSLSAFFGQLSEVLLIDNLNIIAGLPAMTFGQVLNYSDTVSLPLWTNCLFGALGLVIFSVLGIVIDATNKRANYPIRRQFMVSRREQNLLENEHGFSLRADHLCVEFKIKKEKKIALDNLNLSFETNQAIIGLIAENGAGKSTLFKAALGAIRPASGEVLLNGKCATESGPDFYKDIAVVFEENILFENFTVKDQMRIMAMVLEEKESRIADCLIQMGLDDKLGKKVNKLSGGMQRRLNIAMALLKSNPKLYMLDEPSCGVDIESRKYLWRFLKGLKTVTLITTHAMEEVEEICDSIIMLKQGKLIIQGDIMDVKRRLCFGYKVFPNNNEELEQYAVREFTADPFIEQNKGEIRIPFEKENEIVEILEQLNDDCIVKSPSLSEAFINVQQDDFRLSLLDSQEAE